MNSGGRVTRAWSLFGLVLVVFGVGCGESTERVTESGVAHLTEAQTEIAAEVISTTTTSTPTVPQTAPETVPTLEPIPGFGTGVLVIDRPDGMLSAPVMIAATPELRQQGLMNVTDLGGFAGMVFAFEDDTETTFWMENTLLELSLAFVSADGLVVSTVDMVPCVVDEVCPSHAPAVPYRWALEVPVGDLDQLGIDGSTRLSFVVD